ncbi:MAG: endonuclease/exonuclease/phosphatase family protein [Paracoccaceae bacterium]|nr:endonuclease/exonuclease/phosphatase family protein [Paracoccaceae bacterium]
MRIATYNIEWFTELFDDDGTLLADGEWSARYNVTRAAQAEAIAIVMTALDADAIMIIEAPDAHRKRSGRVALETFAEAFDLRTRTALLGFENHTQQEIALLYDPDVLEARHDPIGPPEGGHDAVAAPRFDGAFDIDLDIDAEPERVTWSKPPLELACRSASGEAFRMIGVHAKSKAPHGATGRKEILRASIQNRRKQLAQCIWLRRRIEEHLAAEEPLIVLGDFNDGPGLDEYEKLFGRSGLEIVLGENDGMKLVEPHAAMGLQRRLGAAPTTARFWISSQKRWLEVLLDYIMVSPDLAARRPQWRIWHPFDDPGCYNAPELREALLAASDHFPVTLDIDL